MSDASSDYCFEIKSPATAAATRCHLCNELLHDSARSDFADAQSARHAKYEHTNINAALQSVPETNRPSVGMLEPCLDATDLQCYH